MSIRHNAAIVDYCRTSISALSGSTAGIMGLTGLYGFAFYFISALMLSVSRTFFLLELIWNIYYNKNGENTLK
jgi:hypothetical protein